MDFKTVLESIKKTKRVSVNTDIDGILSVVALSLVVPNLRVTAFNNSKTYEFVLSTEKGKTVVYIDHDKKKGGNLSIGQHIIRNNNHQKCDVMWNINNLFGICNRNYSEKWGGGTFHIIVSELEKLGYRFSFDYDRVVAGAVTVRDLIFRCDSFIDACVNERYSTKMNEFWKPILTEGLPATSETHKFFDEADKWMSSVRSKHANHGFRVKFSTESNNWKTDCNNRIRDVWGTPKGTGFNTISDKFFRMMTDIYHAFGAEVNFETDQTKYDVVNFVQMRYCIADDTEINRLQNDKRIESLVYPKKNTISFQIKPEDTEGMVNKYWEHLVPNQYTNFKSFVIEGHNVWLRKTQDGDIVMRRGGEKKPWVPFRIEYKKKYAKA